jgi:hypothetical protein
LSFEEFFCSATAAEIVMTNSIAVISESLRKKHPSGETPNAELQKDFTRQIDPNVAHSASPKRDPKNTSSLAFRNNGNFSGSESIGIRFTHPMTRVATAIWMIS